MPSSNANMSEKELLTDLLTCEKTLVKTYATCLTESSAGALREILSRHLMECGEDQFDIFEKMQEKQMYVTKPADCQEAAKAVQSAHMLKRETGM